MAATRAMMAHLGNPMEMSRSAPRDQGLLELALRTQSVRSKVIKAVEPMGLDAPVRFYGSITEWERATDAKQKKLIGLKILATYVETGGLYEVGCLSDTTRNDMLKKRSKTGDKKFFLNARQELVKFITENDVLSEAIMRMGRGGA